MFGFEITKRLCCLIALVFCCQTATSAQETTFGNFKFCSKCQEFIKAIVRGGRASKNADSKELKRSIVALLKDATTLHQVFFVSFILGIVREGLNCTELSTLFHLSTASLKNLELKEIFRVYILGKSAGTLVKQRIESANEQNKTDDLRDFSLIKIPTTSVTVPDEEIAKCFHQAIEKYLESRKGVAGQYESFVREVLTDLKKENPQGLSKIPHKIEKLKEMIAIEQISFLIDQLVEHMTEAMAAKQKRDKPTTSSGLGKKIKQLLLMFPYRLLVLVGQKMLAGNTAHAPAKAVIAYIVSSSLNGKKPPQLQYLLQHSIDNKQAEEFELLLSDEK